MRPTFRQVSFALATFSASLLPAQTASMRVSVPSPTAAALGKFGDHPVSLATGTPDIRIPLFTAQGRTLELPLALRYHGSGLRVEEIGGWAGLGWALEAGGTITRTVRGVADDTPSGYYWTGHTWWTSAAWPTPSASTLQSVINEQLDGEPDQYFFSFAGRSGQFVMGPTNASSTSQQVRMIPYQALRIVPDNPNGITSWDITTEDGTRYTFGAAETTTDLNVASGGGEVPAQYGVSYITTWHLTRILAPGGDSIRFHYTPYTATHAQGHYREEFREVTAPGGACVPAFYEVSVNFGVSAQRLDSITAATHTVKFSAAATLRQDARAPNTNAAQEPRLETITVTTPSGTVLREFVLTHDYSIGDRLTLRSVSERDRAGTVLPPYDLSYVAGTFPARTSFAQDHDGYFNGKTQNTSLIPPGQSSSGAQFPGADRTPDGSVARIGALSRITYPTGGHSDFTWEGHEYGSVGSNDAPPAAYGPVQTSAAFADANQGSVTQDFTVGGSATILATVTVNFSPTCAPQFGCPYAEIVGVASFVAPGTYSVSLPVGTYTLHAAEELAGGFAQISVSWQDWITVKKKPAGGIRVAQITDVDAMGGSATRRFRYVLEADTTRSSGAISYEPDYDFNVTGSCSYYSRSSTSKAPLGSATTVAYREVEVLRGVNGEFGRSVHRFRSALDAFDEPLSPAEWPGSRRVSRAWERGQPTGTTDRAGSVMQRRSAQVWTFLSDTVAQPIATRRFRGMSVNAFAAQADVIFGQSTYAYAYHSFWVTSGWAYAASDTTIHYDAVGTNPVATARGYAYANPSHAQLTSAVETAAGGAFRVTRYRYPLDLAAGSDDAESQAITAMQGSAHMPGVVLERSVHDSAGALLTVAAALTTYRITAAGQLLPYQTFVLDAPSPAPPLAPVTVGGGGLAKDSRYVLQETASAYDAWGRVASLTDPRGKVTTFTYGGNAHAAFLTGVTRLKDAAGLADLTTTLDWNGDGQLRRITDEAGRKAHFGYDLFGRLTQRWNHDSVLVASYAYAYSRTSLNGWTFAPSAPNAVTTTTFLRHTPSPVSVPSTEYLDGLGRPIQSVLQGGGTFYVSATQYDAMGRPMRTWKPYTRTVAGYDASFATNATAFYNSYHADTTAKPYDSTAYTADALDRVRRETPPFLGASATAFRVLAYGSDPATGQRFTETTDESGKKVQTYADRLGHPARSILGVGAAEQTTTTLVHDVAGRRVQVTDPRGIVSSVTYSTRGLAITSASPDAGNVSRQYDRAGHERYRQDATQAGAGTVFFTTYDFAGRPLLEGLGAATLAALDPDATVPPALETTQAHWLTVRAYDAKPSTAAFPWSLFSAEIGPLTLQRVSGRLAAEAQRSNGAWQVTLYSYDAEGRVATRHQFTQDAAGSAVLAALITLETSAYDLRGARTERGLTVGALAWHQWDDYDDRGLRWKVFAATTATKPATADVTYTYRPSGAVATRQFAGGPSVPLRYTIREQLERIGDPAGTTYPFSARYAYHANGTVSETEFYQAGTPATAKRYRYVISAANYDALNRLKGADFSPWSGSGWTSTAAYDLTSIAYDASGNLTKLRRYRAAGTLVDQLAYAYPAGANRLSSVTEAAGASAEAWDAESGALTHDANGNVVTAPGPYAITAATHDAWNRPLTVTRAGTTTQYRYTAGGARLGKQVGGGALEFYVTDGPTTLAVVTVPAGGGAPSAWHFNLLAGDAVIGRQPHSGARRHYHADLVRSVRAVTAGASVLESRDYDPWGVELAGRTLGSGTKEGFTGQERDAERGGVDEFWARGYLPALGRWAGVDPLRDSFPAWSAYNYVLNDPVGKIDVDGRVPVCIALPSACIAVAAGIVEGASAVYDLYQTYRAFRRSGAEGVESLQTTMLGAALPGPGHLWARGARAVERGSLRAGAQAFGGLSRAGEFGIKPYGQLRYALRGTGLHAHHLIERRFAAQMGQNAQQGLAVAVTPAEHQAFTNAWHQAIPYGAQGTGSATQQQVLGAARMIYANYPEILKALGL